MPSFLQVGKGYSSAALPGEIMNYRLQLPHPLRDHSEPRPGAGQGRPGTGAARPGDGSGGLRVLRRDQRRRRADLEHGPEPGRAGAREAVHPRRAADGGLEPLCEALHHGDGARDVRIPTPTSASAFYEAEKPWGPWFKIKEQASFAQGTIFFYQFPTKWMNADLSAWMAFTGTDRWADPGVGLRWMSSRCRFVPGGEGTPGRAGRGPRRPGRRRPPRRLLRRRADGADPGLPARRLAPPGGIRPPRAGRPRRSPPRHGRWVAEARRPLSSADGDGARARRRADVWERYGGLLRPGNGLPPHPQTPLRRLVRAGVLLPIRS